MPAGYADLPYILRQSDGEYNSACCTPQFADLTGVLRTETRGIQGRLGNELSVYWHLSYPESTNSRSEPEKEARDGVVCMDLLEI